MAIAGAYGFAAVEFLRGLHWRSFCLVFLAVFAGLFTVLVWAYYIGHHSPFNTMTALLGIKSKMAGSRLSKKGSTKEAMAKDSTAPPSESICGGEDLKVNNKIPSKSDLEKCAELPILDVNKKSLPFKSLYTSENGGRRVLVIFIRHFFCGVCCAAIHHCTMT